MSIRLKRRIGRKAEDYGWRAGRNFSQAASAERPAPGRDHAPGTLEWLRACVRDGAPILVAGGTSTGKTTFVNNIVLPEIGPRRRVITVGGFPGAGAAQREPRAASR